MGGSQTLASYGVIEPDLDAARAAVPERHRAFLRSLPHSHLVGDLLFVHAGLDPRVPLEWQGPDDLIWIRGEFLEDTRPHPWLVVHGHTPVPTAHHYGNRVCLDTGAGYGKQLTCAVFEDIDCWLLSDAGRTPLLPDS